MRNRHIVIVMSLIAAIASLIAEVNTAYAGPGGGTYYANSPASGVTGTALRKFVDSLPGICEVSGTNNLGQCLPLAVPDTATYSGSDYYEIGLRQYSEKMHSDLPKENDTQGLLSDQFLRHVERQPLSWTLDRCHHGPAGACEICEQPADRHSGKSLHPC